MFPLVVYGSNAIAAYVGPILDQGVYSARLDLEDAGWDAADIGAGLAAHGDGPLRPLSGGWVYTLGYLLVVWLALLELRRRKLFLRV